MSKKIIAVLLAVCLAVSLACVPAFATSTDTVTLFGDYDFNDAFTVPDGVSIADLFPVAGGFYSKVLSGGEVISVLVSSVEFDGSTLKYVYWDDTALADVTATVWTTNAGWWDNASRYITYDYPVTRPGLFGTWLSANSSQPVSDVEISGCWQFKPDSELTYPDRVGFVQPVTYWQSKTFETAEVMVVYPDLCSSNRDVYPIYIDATKSDGSRVTGLYDSGWWGEFERYRLIDYGSTPQLVTQAYYDWFTANADPVNRDDFSSAVSGEWNWNDTLPDFADYGFHYCASNITANGTEYLYAYIVPANFFGDGIGVCVLLISSDGSQILAYLDGYGWLDGTFDVAGSNESGTFDESTLIASDIYQTWDFGEGSEQFADFTSYLTTNATQPTAEPTTVTIPAGTYRFADVLSAPSADLDQAINFQTSPQIDFENGELLDGYNVGTVICVTPSSRGWGYDGETMLLYLFSSGLVPVYADTEGFNCFAVVANLDTLAGYGQTITLPTDQEVSTEFYEWFTANAEPVAEESYTVSGKWKFHDDLSSPVGGIDMVSAEVNFSVVPGLIVNETDGSLTANYDSVANCGYISAVSNGDFLNGDYSSCTVDFAFLDFDGGTLTVYNEPLSRYWNALYDGFTAEGLTVSEDLKGYGQTLDFGTEPQTVSEEFYTWFVANADPVTDDDGSTDDGNGDAGGTGSGGDNSGSTGDGSGSGGDTGSGDTSGDGSTCDHSGVIGWLEKIWQAIKDGFESVLTKLEELVGLSSDSPSESALKDASSDVVDTVTDLFYGDDTEDGSTDSGSDGSSSGSGGSKFKRDDAKELSNISGRVKSWFAFDADIGELFDIVEGGSDWYSEETANGIDSTVSVATYGPDSDPYSMQDYYQYIDYLFARYGGDAK